MKLNWVFGVCVLMLFLTMNSALAYGPRTHVTLLDQLCAESNSWPNKGLCCGQYKDFCMAGMLETDRDVFHYFTNFKKYELDHSWNTVTNCFKVARDAPERAWCEGIALHLTMDSISHNEYIPDQTKQWVIFPQPVTHVFLESGIDDLYPSVQDEATVYLSPEILNKYCKGTDSISYRSTGKESDWECDALAGAVSKGGMYQSVFLVGSLMNWGYQAFITVSGLLPTIPFQSYEDLSKELCRQTFQDIWPTQYDPTGYEALGLANLGWNVLSMLIIIAMVVVIGINVFKLIKRRR